MVTTAAAAKEGGGGGGPSGAVTCAVIPFELSPMVTTVPLPMDMASLVVAEMPALLSPSVVTESLVIPTKPPPYLPPLVATIPAAPAPWVATLPLVTTMSPAGPYLEPIVDALIPVA